MNSSRVGFYPRMLVSLFGVLLLYTSTGCQECVSLESQACTCADGRTGKQLCDSSKSVWAGCECSGSSPPDGGVVDTQGPESTGETQAEPPPVLPPVEECTPACQNQGVCEKQVCVCPQNYMGKTCGECKQGYEGYPQCKRAASGEDFPIYLQGSITGLLLHQDALHWFHLEKQKPYVLQRKTLLDKTPTETLYTSQNTTQELFLTLSLMGTAFLSCETSPFDSAQEAVCVSIPMKGGQPTELLRTKNLIYLSVSDGKTLYAVQEEKAVSLSSSQLLKLDLQSKQSSVTLLEGCNSPSNLSLQGSSLWVHCTGTYSTVVRQNIETISWKEGSLLSFDLATAKLSPVWQANHGVLSTVYAGDKWYLSTAYSRKANNGGISVLDPKTQQRQELLSLRGDMVFLRADETSLFWVEANAAPGLKIGVNREDLLPEKPARHYYIRSMPLAGGKVTTHVDSLLPIVSLALHKGLIYYATYQLAQDLTTIWKHTP